MRQTKSKRLSLILYFSVIFILIFLIISTNSPIYSISIIDIEINNGLNSSPVYRYDLNKQPGNPDMAIFPTIFESYSPPYAAIISIESLKENSSGFFGNILITDEYSMAKIPENRTSIQNLTNIIFWKYNDLESWKEYTEFYHNKIVNGIFHKISLDILNGELFEIREYSSSNITEHIFINIFDGITFNIEWHNTNLFPEDKDITEHLFSENSISLELIQENDSDTQNSSSLPPIITISIILGTNIIFLLFGIKKLILKRS